MKILSSRIVDQRGKKRLSLRTKKVSQKYETKIGTRLFVRIYLYILYTYVRVDTHHVVILQKQNVAQNVTAK